MALALLVSKPRTCPQSPPHPGTLTAALGWIGRRAWAVASAHAAAGLVAGVIFGAGILVLTMQAAPKPLPAGGLVAKGVNELLFPIGCAMVVFFSEVLGKRSRQ